MDICTLISDLKNNIVLLNTQQQDTFDSILAELKKQTNNPESLLTLDNRGKVLWSDDFESSTLKWNVTYATTGSNAANVTYAHTYDQCWRVTDDGNDSSVMISKPLPYREHARMGFQASFMPDVTNTPSYIELRIAFYDGTLVHRGTLRIITIETGIVGVGQSLIVYPNGDAVPIISHGIPYDVVHNWQTAKLVIDYNIGTGIKQYVRALVDGYEVNLAAVGLYSEASALAKHIECQIWVFGAGAGSAVCYLDDAIVTIEEP